MKIHKEYRQIKNSIVEYRSYEMTNKQMWFYHQFSLTLNVALTAVLYENWIDKKLDN